MADRNGALARPVWMIQAEEAKIKSEAEKAAAAKAAFEATFRDVDKNREMSSDSEAEEAEALARRPIGPVDPSKCSAAGAGIGGGTACAPSTFIVTTKDSDGRKVPSGGALIKVKVSPGVGVGGSDIDGIVKDQGDGSYSATYVAPKRGNYMVHVECNGKPIMGSPFPVFFSAGSSTGGLLGLAPPSNFPNMVNPNMPNMPNYTGSVSGAFPGLLGMIPGLVPGSSGGVTLPGAGASLGEVCRDYLSGKCFKTDCKLSHPPHNMLMTAIAATTYSMGSLPQVPMAPSAAAMAAAQAIMAAQALQAHAAQVQAQSLASKESSGLSEKEGKGDALKRTVQVSNLNPLLTIEQIKQLFGFCGTVVDCTIADSKHFAYIEYSKPEEANAALALNNMDVGGRPLNVEMAKMLPQKPAVPNSSLPSSLPIMMQQAVAMQQMQFQQALLMQQTMNAQQAANRAATMKSATDLASARAAEISKMLNPEGIVTVEKETEKKSRSPSPAHVRSKSKSRSPGSHHRRKRSHSRSRSVSPSRDSRDRRLKSPVKSRRRSRSYSPLPRSIRHRRSRSPARSHRYSRNVYDYERRSYRDARDSSDRSRRKDSHSLQDHRSTSFRKNRSRSISPHDRRSSHRKRSVSPKHHRHESSTGRSRSPGHRRDKVHRLSPQNDHNKDKDIHPSRSSSVDDEHVSVDKQDESKDNRKHHGRRRSRSSSAESKGHKRGKLSPRDSGKSRSKHHRRSRSRSLDDNHSSKHEDHPRRHKDSSHGKRRQSKSADEDHELHLTTENGESKDEKHLSPTHVELGHESGGEKDRSRHGRKKDRNGRRHSRSVSTEDERDMRRWSSRSKSDKSKHKHRRHSRSRSAEDRYCSNDVIKERKSRKSSQDARKAANHDSVTEGSEKRCKNSNELGAGVGTSSDECEMKSSPFSGIGTKPEIDRDDLDGSVVTDTVFPGNALKESMELSVEHCNHGETMISGDNEKGVEDED